MKRIMQYCMACIVLAGTLSSCSRQEEPQYAPDGGEVLFQGLVKNSNMISRSDFNEKDFVLINSSTDAHFGDIRICSSTSEASSEADDVIAEYKPADGWQGRLSAEDPANPLTWSKGTNAEYTFYACTYPSVSEGSVVGGVTMDDVNPMQGTVTFGTQKKTDLEHFIVAKEGPLKYAENGSYVKLLFYRPVAKIQIDSITHFDANGSQTPIKKCMIDFPNLYRTARFYAKKDWTDVWLQRGEDGYQPPLLGLSWEWDISVEDAASDYVLYVHPFSFSFPFGSDEADGGQPDPTQPGYFRITATIKDTENKDTEKVYFASLAGLKNITELKAGQFMKMQIAVQDGGGGGLGCQIVDWNTKGEQTVSHRRAGIYTQKDADNLLKILQTSPLDTGALNNYCRDGKIYLYTSVNWSKVTGSLTIPEGYTLCKQGYSVTLGEGGQLVGGVQ